MVDLLDVSLVLIGLVASVVAHFVIARWLARKIHGATSTEALEGYASQIQGRVLAAMQDPATVTAMGAMVEKSIPGMMSYVGAHGEDLADALGDALDGWANSERGQARIRELLIATTNQIGPAVQGLLTPERLQPMLEQLAPKLRQEFLRWVGSQKGGAATSLKSLMGGKKGGLSLEGMAMELIARKFFPMEETDQAALPPANGGRVIDTQAIYVG